MNGAQVAVKTLKAHGLNRVIGIPGVQNLEYFDAFAEEGMEVVLVSHELAASFMADAIGRVSGDPGVVAVVPGPGLTNIFTGLAEALLDSAPLLVLVPGVRTNYQESFQLHEIDQKKAASALAKCYFRVHSADDIPGAVARAIHCAKSGEPGPVIVEAPYNVLLEQTSVSPANPRPIENPLPSDADLDRAADLILSCKAPALHVGFGASDAAKEVLELASRLDAPVSTTISGRGVIAEDHDLSVGFGFGHAGTELAEKIFKDRDLIIAAGCKFSEVGSGSYDLKIPRLIHLDINPDVLGKNFPAQIALCGDAKATLRALIDRLRDKRPLIEFSALRHEIRVAHQERKKNFENLKPWPDRVNPARLLYELRGRAARDAILTTDSGAHTFYAVFSFEAYVPRSILSPVDYSAMGYGIPAAIGAALAAPGRRVIAAVGDGGVLMTGTELATIARLKLPVMVVVFNDGALGLIKQAQQRLYRKEVAVDIHGPDYQKFAEAFGIKSIRINNDQEIGPALDQAFDMKEPVLLDAHVEYRDMTRHTTGSSISIIKRTPPSIILRMAARAAWRTLFGQDQ